MLTAYCRDTVEGSAALRPLLLYLCTARTPFLHFFIGCSLVGVASGRQSGC